MHLVRDVRLAACETYDGVFYRMILGHFCMVGQCCIYLGYKGIKESTCKTNEMMTLTMGINALS